MRKKEGDKKNDILRAATKVFAEQGYYNAKIARIADEANVANGSVYLYFKNKENIIDTLFEQLWQELAKELKQVLQRKETDPLQKIFGMVDVVFETFSKNRSLTIVFINEHHLLLQKGNGVFTPYYEQFLDMAAEIVKQGIEKGLFHKEIDLHIFRYFVFGGLRHMLHLWAEDETSFPLERIQKSIKFFLEKGICIA